MSNLTIRDIARLCNVSTSTVSRAMNGESGINKETKKRILQVIEEHNFRPNNSARNLKMIESNTIAIIVKGMSNLFFQELIAEMEKIRCKDYTFLFHPVGENENEVDVARQLIVEKKLKGIIFLGGLAHPSKAAVSEINIPYVRCTGAIIPGQREWTGTSVAIDDEKESYRVTEYLIKKGHTRIAMITTGNMDNSVGQLRLEGYKRALAENEVAFAPELLRMMDPKIQEYSMENGYVTTKKLLEAGVDFTALYVTSDRMSLGAYKAIQEAGKRIPEDYSVISFDGIEMTKYYHPSLTTLKQPVEAMAQAAIDQMMKAIEGEETVEQMIFEGKLLERDSVRELKR